MDEAGISERAHAIREVLKARHGMCDHTACHLAQLWADDVQEILDLATTLDVHSAEGSPRPT